MKGLLAAVLMMLGMMGQAEEILWWMVDETATVDNESITSFLESHPEDDYHWNMVRIKVTSGDNVIYLDNYQDWGSGWERSSGADGVWIGESGDGRGASTGNWATQSSLDGLSRELFEEAIFQVQLGTIEIDDGFNVVDWFTLAETDPVTKATLQQHLYERGSMQPPGYTQWTPLQFYTHSPVPEPSSLLLVLIGSSIFMLKRKVKV